MNSNRYRTIFSKRLGMLVAVAETTKAQGKSSSAVPGSGAPVGRALPHRDANRSLLETAASDAMALARVAAAVGATLGFSAQALANDECGGPEAAGADTITCTDPAYANGITYENSDGLTLTLDNGAMVSTANFQPGVAAASSPANTNDLVINAANFDTVTANDAPGLYVFNEGPTGNTVITLTNGRVVTTGDDSAGLLSVLAGSNPTGTARVTMNGGTVETNGFESHGLSARNTALGGAETSMTGGTITVEGGESSGLKSQVLNPSSAGVARITMSGGSISARDYGLYAHTTGSGSADVTMTQGVITTDGTGIIGFGESGSNASALARIDGGSITAGSDGVRVSAEGDATIVMTAGTIITGDGGLDASAGGSARATLNGGSITLTAEGTGVEVGADAGDAVITMTGGAISGSADYSKGLYSESDETGANRVMMSGGTIDLQGEESIGIQFERGNVGVNELAMSGGSIISSGTNADGIQVYWGDDDATYDLDLTGGSVTGGSGFGAAIRLQSPAGGTVDIGTAATVTAGSSGIALVVGADPWDGVIYNGGDLVLTTAGTVTGDLLLGLGTDTVNVTGGTLNGNIVGGVGDTVNFALGTGAFTYASPYAIGGVDSVSVSSGTARINGTINAGAVSVANGGTLGGGGTINAAVTVANGGRIAPGNSPGTLTMGTLVLSSGSILDFELGAADVEGGPLNDLINVNGDLTLDGTLNVRIATGGTYGVGVYRLINYTGALTDNGLDLGLMPNGSANTLQTSVANQINLVNTHAAVEGFNYWDGPGALNDGVISGGTGTWTASPTDQNWTSADGATNGPFLDAAMAIFMGTAGTVTVDSSLGGINVTGMQFATNGYRVEGDAITLTTGTNALRVGDGTTDGAGYTATIVSALNGDGTLDKTDLGTLVLTGANTYTGGTNVTSGTLQLGDGGTSGSLLGNIDNDGTLAFNRSDATAFAGVISGTGTVRHSGSGTTTLTAAGSSSSALDVQAGTLEVASGASFSARDTNVAASTTLRNSGTLSGTSGADRFALAGTFVGDAELLDGEDQVQIAATATFAEARFDGGAGVDTLDLTHGSALTLPEMLATHFEHLNKLGAGALTLAGTVNGFSDRIVLAQGTAHLNAATVNTGELRVESGVTLTGTGSLSGGLTNHGVLSPGNSPGTILVGGSFTQGASGRLVSEITRTGVDLLDVGGTATLGGTHEIHIEYGLYLDGTTQTLVRAAGGISGNFANVQINPSALMAADHEVGVSAETVSFTRQATTTVTDPNTNRDRYAQWLDDRIAEGNFSPEMIAYIDTLLQQPTAESAGNLLGDVAEPVAPISQNSISMLGAGYARAVFDRFARVDGVRCAPTQASSDALNCAWMRGQRQWGDADGDGFGSGYDWETDGVQFGLDRQVSAWNIGISFAYGDTDISAARGARNELRSKMGTLYGSYTAGRLGFDALALYSANENRTRRSVAIGTTSQHARAEFDSDSVGLGARLGYRLTSDASPLVRPFAEIFYDRIDGSSFTEHDAGAGNLSVSIHDREGLRGTVGVQLANDYEGFGHLFRPSLELGVAHQFEDAQSTLDVRPFVGGESFRTYGVAMDRTAYLAKAALGISLGANAALSIGYSGELAGDYSQHEANLGVRIAW